MLERATGFEAAIPTSAEGRSSAIGTLSKSRRGRISLAPCLAIPEPRGGAIHLMRGQSVAALLKECSRYRDAEIRGESLTLGGVQAA